MMKQMVAIVSLMVLGAACSDNGLVEENETLEARLEVVLEEQSILNETASELQALLDVAESDLALLETSQSEVEEARLVSQDDLTKTESELVSAQSELASVSKQLDDVSLELAEFKVQFDPEIRKSLLVEVASEVERACVSAIDKFDTAIANLIIWSDNWLPVSSRTELIAAVEECSASERSKTAEQRESDRLSACISVEPDQIEKRPDAYTGTCVSMYAVIVQFDSATGPCAFHANVSNRQERRSYNYDLRAAFGYSDSESQSAFVTDCSALDEIDGDDIVQIWATGNGAYSYSTTNGSTNTIPSFKIEKVVLIRKE